MSNVTNSQDVRKWLEAELKKHKDVVLDKVSGYFAGKLLTYQPIEDGHAHEAWITAFTKTNSSQLKKLYAVLDHFENLRSHDPKASTYGDGKLIISDKSSTIFISNKLPFVYKLEHGLPIRVGDESGNKGKKIDPVKRPPDKGPLYGKRSQGSQGLLVFEKNGQLIKTKVWTPSGDDTGFLFRAIKDTVQFIKQNGLKVKQSNT
jgi:hypothetical protein